VDNSATASELCLIVIMVILLIEQSIANDVPSDAASPF
jgi:hypothetical protein